MRTHSSFFKKISFSVLLIVLVVDAVGLGLSPTPVSADFEPPTPGAGIPTVITGDLPGTVKSVFANIQKALKIAALNAVSTAVTYALRKVSYDTAVYIASGGKGQGALAHTKNFGAYLGDVANDAAGQGLEELGKPWGLNLCKLPDANVDLALRMAIRSGQSAIPGIPSKYNKWINGPSAGGDPTKSATCKLSDAIVNNFNSDSWKSRYNNAQSSVEHQFNDLLGGDTSQSGVGNFLAMSKKITEKVVEAKDASTKQRAEGGGIKEDRALIDKNRITQPAAINKKKAEDLTPQKEADKSEQRVGEAISSGQYEILPSVVSTFVGTLASTMLKNLQKGILPFGICTNDTAEGCQSDGAGLGGFENEGISGGRRAAEELFSEFLTVKISSVDEYNALSELSSCSDSPGLYNCRADSGLVQAATEGVTVRDALKQGWLHGKFQLIPPSRVDKNASNNCYNDAYCYANLKILRQLRILPIGFEIAALNSDPDKPWTLEQAINGFDDCKYRKEGDRVVGIAYDPVNKPFCHLIDPNWVIRSYPTRCNAQGPGATLLDKTIPNRREDCVDLSSCVSFNKDGSCANYAYCAREKNSWTFDAGSCDGQYRTCKTFQDTQGQTYSYLYRTLDTRFCTQNNVGCRAYSLTKDDQGWKAPGSNGYDYVNQGIYFNNKVSTSCGPRSAGCSVFGVTSSTYELLLRKAPNYLGCYDANPATPQTEWPQTRAELQRVKPDAACKDYAGVCIPEEVSCNWYTPLAGAGQPAADRIPGRFKPAQKIENEVTWNDQCDPRCVGYAAYREMPSNYSSGQDLAYIIPSSGETCQEEEVGCSSFTNLSTDAGGVEKVEYYSDLRSCIAPDPARQKNFFTYEGSDQGFQLKSYTLVKDEAGGPKYFYRTPDDLKDYDAECNETLYKNHAVSKYCRQFNDDKGQVFYRLINKTIVVDQSCTPYRLNATDLYTVNLTKDACDVQKGFWNKDHCEVCFQNGEYRNGFCFYYGLPDGVNNSAGTSDSCSQEANTCRAYKGNAGNNLKELFTDTFEGGPTTSLTSWNPGSIRLSSESTQAGEHSLAYIGAGEVYKFVSLSPGKSYDLSFWAKGSGQTVTVALEGPDGAEVKKFSSVSIGDVWKYYHFGAVEFNGNTTNARLAFRNLVNGRLFIDNVHMVEVAKNINLVKKTLSVDPVCDTNLDDNLPGEALGCSAYTDPQNQTFYLTNFSYLCRSDAIGCTALFDEQNTPQDAGALARNVWLNGVAGEKPTITIDGRSFACAEKIPAGETGCYTNITGYTAEQIVAAGGVFKKSTVYVPPDGSLSNPIYLVANENAQCSQSDLGCTLAGVETITPAGPVYSTTTIKNDPASYDTTLCQQEAVGCNSYSSSEGNLYFKDPKVVGQKICSYRAGVSVNDIKTSGWFWKGVGVCSNDQKAFCSSNPGACDTNSKKYCVGSGDCGGSECQGISDQPCYPDYFQEGGVYGLWSFGDGDKYGNFVGECPEAQNQCTEFIDHNDSDAHYYLIKDSKLNAGDCNGKVSQREGCALFDQTDNPNKFWSTSDSYLATDQKPGKPIDGATLNPVRANDANVLIKVKRDRQCGEWIQCRTSHPVRDEQTGKWRNVCDGVGRCNKAPESSEDSSSSNCASWVDDDSDQADNNESNSFRNTPLTADLYVNRDTSWRGMDFDGFSVPGLYPIEEVSQANVGTPDAPNWKLVKLLACGGNNCAPKSSVNDVSCTTTPGNLSCGASRNGSCINGLCIENLDGSNFVSDQDKPNDLGSIKVSSHQCRAYPESDSPFPSTAYTTGDKAVREFSAANFCNETPAGTRVAIDGPTAYSCDCSYTKVNYGDVFTKYWNYSYPNASGNIGTKNQIPSGICQGGASDGLACTDNTGCVEGTCLKKKGDNKKILGWEGFCLEEDSARTMNGDPSKHLCTTWYPVDTLVGVPDINNQHAEAGFQPPKGGGGNFYCLDGNAAGYSPIERTIQTRNPMVINAPYGYAGHESSEKGFFPATLAESNFTLSDIENITFVVDSPDDEDPKSGLQFKIWPNDPTVGKPQALYVVNTDGNDNGSGDKHAPGRVVTGRYLQKENEFILLYGSNTGDDNKKDEGYVSAEGRLCFNGSTGISCRAADGNLITKEGLKFGGVPSGDETLWNPIYDSGQICNATTGGGNWHAIRLKFDPNTRKFLGYYWFNCNASSADGALHYYVKFTLKEWCRKVVDTTVDYASLSDTAPWTNRLWKAGYVLNPLGYTYNTDMSPFGSLIAGIPANNQQLQITEFRGGNPLKCYNNQDNDPLKIRSCEFSPSLTDPAYLPKGTAGAPFSCPDGNCVQVDKTGTEVGSTASRQSLDAVGKPALGRLFARPKRWYNFDQAFSLKAVLDPINSGPYVGYTVQGSSIFDYTETGDAAIPTAKPKAPLIYPLGACSSGDVCIEDISRGPGLTVNSESTKDIKIFTSNAKTFLRFFAFADSDQMPIRKIQVDWGEKNAQYSIYEGLYRNRRGYRNAICVAKNCQVTEVKDLWCNNDIQCGAAGRCDVINNRCVVTTNTGQVCNSNIDCAAKPECAKENSPDFGHIDGKTCDNAYFQFEHVYQCTRKSSNFTANPADCGNAQLFPTGCCLFKPRVQVMDNWNWCNGRCPGGPGGDGCFNRTGLPECNFGGYCSNDKNISCRADTECGSGGTCIGPWTSFSKYVIVAPKK